MDRSIKLRENGGSRDGVGVLLGSEFTKAVPLRYTIAVLRSGPGTRVTFPEPHLPVPDFDFHGEYGADRPVIREPRFSPNVGQLLDSVPSPKYPVAPEGHQTKRCHSYKPENLESRRHSAGRSCEVNGCLGLC